MDPAENEVAVQAWTTAATTVTPFLEDWLGAHPRSQLTLLDLPDPEDAPYETGALLAVSLHESPADKLEGALVHALTHAFHPARTAAAATLAQRRSGDLYGITVDGKTPGARTGARHAGGRPVRACLGRARQSRRERRAAARAAISPVYYRTKAAYVLWMLRDMVGDAALSVRPSRIATSESGNARGRSLENLLKQAGVNRDLSWFFEDWVDADKGLPDLSIVSVFPNAAQEGTFLVAVNVANAGYAAAEVPVTVRTAKNSVTERVLVPARGSVVQRLLVMGKPIEVQVNDGTVPETQASVHVTHLDEPRRILPPRARPIRRLRSRSRGQLSAAKALHPKMDAPLEVFCVR